MPAIGSCCRSLCGAVRRTRSTPHPTPAPHIAAPCPTPHVPRLQTPLNWNMSEHSRIVAVRIESQSHWSSTKENFTSEESSL
eukprot:9537518-Alexandrium_andersonii.AAC.1